MPDRTKENIIITGLVILLVASSIVFWSVFHAKNDEPIAGGGTLFSTTTTHITINSPYATGKTTKVGTATTITPRIWTKVASQLNSETDIYSLLVYQGNLYGGTSPNGNLFMWNGSNAWVQKAAASSSQTIIYSLATYNDKIYGGTGPGGRLFEWDGSNTWISRASVLNSQTRIHALITTSTYIYGGTYNLANLQRWATGATVWTRVAPQVDSQVQTFALVIYGGKIYGCTGYSGSTGANLQVSSGGTWTKKAGWVSGGGRMCYAMVVMNDKIYGISTETSNPYGGRLLEWNGSSAWVVIAGTSTASGQTYNNWGMKNLYAAAVMNNEIYAVGSESSRLLKWDGTNSWVSAAEPAAGSETSTFWSLIEWNGSLYAGNSKGELWKY